MWNVAKIINSPCLITKKKYVLYLKRAKEYKTSNNVGDIRSHGNNWVSCIMFKNIAFFITLLDRLYLRGGNLLAASNYTYHHNIF